MHTFITLFSGFNFWLNVKSLFRYVRLRTPYMIGLPGLSE